MSSTNHFCNVCSVWIAGNIGSIKRHELSDFHKMNVQRKVKLANDKSKHDKQEASRVRKELEAITVAATTAMSNPPINSHSLSSSKATAVPVGWVTLVDPKSGKQYLFNRSTGETRWVETSPPADQPKPLVQPLAVRCTINVPSKEKEVQGPVPSTTAPPPRPMSSAPPPRPVVSSNGAPPPRPQSAKPKTTTNPTKPQSVEILKSVMMSATEASLNDPSKRIETGTGFGDWEDVVISDRVIESSDSVPETTESDIVLFQKRKEMTPNFQKLVVKREAPDEDTGQDEESGLFASRKIKKSSRNRSSLDDS